MYLIFVVFFSETSLSEYSYSLSVSIYLVRLRYWWLGNQLLTISNDNNIRGLRAVHTANGLGSS